MKKNFTTIQTLLIGYIIIILAGALLLWLPFSVTDGHETAFVDALFTATSALSTTGLATVDTGTHFSMVGQLIILILIQIGGLGYMIFIGLIIYGFRTQFSINGRILFTESIARPKLMQIKKFIKAVILFTFFFEFSGAVGLFIVFIQRIPFQEAVYSAVFHSVSAFCTAGFSIYSDSFTAYANEITANSIIAIITIAGGIGFFVLYDLTDYFRRFVKRQQPSYLTDHSKLVLIISVILMVSGTFILFIVDDNTNRNLSMFDRFLTASFQAISASTTTGFNTVDIGSISSISLMFIVFLMFIGASPGSTGGGIKTTSFGIIFLFLRSLLTNRKVVSVFQRSIETTTLHKGLGLALMAGIYLMVIVFLMSINDRFSLLQVIFETASALGTVGLSMGITPGLDTSGKIIITITMLIGRVGPLALGYSLAGRYEPKKFVYPNGTVMIG